MDGSSRKTAVEEEEEEGWSMREAERASWS